jgi:hypothetical protein
MGYFAQLSISRFGSCFTKKSNFGTLKMEKSTFRGTKQKSAFVAFLAIPKATRMSDMASF